MCNAIFHLDWNDVYDDFLHKFCNPYGVWSSGSHKIDGRRSTTVYNNTFETTTESESIEIGSYIRVCINGILEKNDKRVYENIDGVNVRISD